MNMLTPNKSKAKSQSRSTSLREKKMILEKERDEREKYENYLEMRKT